MPIHTVAITPKMEKVIRRRPERNFTCYFKNNCANCNNESTDEIVMRLIDRDPRQPYAFLLAYKCTECNNSCKVRMMLTRGRAVNDGAVLLDFLGMFPREYTLVDPRPGAPSPSDVVTPEAPNDDDEPPEELANGIPLHYQDTPHHTIAHLTSLKMDDLASAVFLQFLRTHDNLNSVTPPCAPLSLTVWPGMQACIRAENGTWKTLISDWEAHSFDDDDQLAIVAIVLCPLSD